MHPVYLALDPYLIWFYRLTGQAALNFVLGTFALALLAVLAGEITSCLAMLLVRPHFSRVSAEAGKYQDLSLEALKAGNRPAYEAANRLANDAFSKSFFMQLTLSACFFWPVFFALGWMQERFYGLEFPVPFPGLSLGYIGAFILIYMLACLLFRQVKRRLLTYRRPDADLSDTPGPTPGGDLLS